MPEYTEEELLEKARETLDRNYGFAILEQDFVLLIRIPKIQIEEIWDDDLYNIIERMKTIKLEKVQAVIVTVYLVADKSHLEIMPELFFKALMRRDSTLVLRAVREAKRRLMGERDPMIKRIMNELTEVASRKILEYSRSGSKVVGLHAVRRRGRVVGYRPLPEDQKSSDVAILPTIKIAALHSRSKKGKLAVDIRDGDIQEKIHRIRIPTFVSLIIDTSKYQDIERFKYIRAVATDVLKSAYERRDQLALVTFRGDHADVPLPFSLDVEHVMQAINRAELGGLTPLPSAIATGLRVLKKRAGEKFIVVLIMILFTDGTANVPLYPGGNVRHDLMRVCQQIKSSNVVSLVIDISEEGTYKARELAYMLGGRYYHPPLFRRRKLELGVKYTELFKDSVGAQMTGSS